MGCFSGQKLKKRLGEQQSKPDPVADESEPGAARPVVSTPPSFRSRVRAIQNAQRFINSNPKLRSSHPGYGREDRDATGGLAAAALSPTLPLGGRARSATAELGSTLFDVTTANLSGRPMPLPSPQPSPKPSAYRLPRPHEHAAVAPIASPLSLSPFTSPKISPSPSGNHGSSFINGSNVNLSPFTSPKISPSTSGNHGSSFINGLNVKIHPSDLQPLPPPREAVAGLTSFTYEELAAACQNFSPGRCIGDGGASPAYTGVIKSERKGEKKTEITVVQVCERWQQGYKEWLAELSAVTRLHGSHLCKLLGFYYDEGSTERRLVYEKLPKGSLDRLLYGGGDSPPLDWPSRVKIALGAAQGLSYLHEKSPEQVVYRDFGSSNIDVDVDFSSKLSGYRFASTSGEAENSNNTSNSLAEAYRAPETLNRPHVLSPKSNIWSYGVVLLELLTGRRNMDCRAPKDERNLVKWTKPFLMDEGRLFLIMDPKLQGRFPAKGAKLIADLALQCLQQDPSRRPSMREVVDVVKPVQEMRYTIRFPLKEPTNTANTAGGAPAAPSPLPISFGSSPSIRGVIKTHIEERTTAAAKRSPTKFDLIESPPLRPLIIPQRSCATSFAMEGVLTAKHHEYSSGPLERLQGF